MKLPPRIALSILCLCAWFIALAESALSKDELDINKPNSEQLSQIIRLNSMLRGVGINAVRLAIVGGQSSGKSSVIEGILGISLPKGDGTQTRVPIEIIASKGSRFVATVGVRNPNEPGTYYKAPEKVSDKADLEKKIRDMQTFALDKANNLNGFSSIPVVVDVQDVGLYDLTFVDLPGLIQSSAFGDALKKHDEVHAVVETEANKPGTILVHVISAENNINNGQGKQILDKTAGSDRIGVITKPDKLGGSDGDTNGIVEEYTKLLQNRFEGLQYAKGWYVVKSPVPTKNSTAETILAERKNEMDFYNNNPLWKEIVQNADANNRIGFSNLRNAMSVILVHDFERRKYEYAAQLSKMITELQKDIHSNKVSVKERMEQDIVLLSTISGALRQAKDFEVSVSSIKNGFDEAFRDLRTTVMRDIPGFRLLSYTLNPKASTLETIIPNYKGKKPKGANKDMDICVNKFDYYNMQKNNIFDLIGNANVLSMSDDILSIPTMKRLQNITKNWEQEGMNFSYKILEIVMNAAKESITKKGGADIQSQKSYEHAATMTYQDVNKHLSDFTNSIIRSLIGPYTTDQEMLFTLKEAYAVYFGRVLEGNGEHILKVIRKLQENKMSVMRVAGAGAGGIALVAITATLITTISGMLPFLAAGTVAAPLLFLVPGGGSLLTMGASVMVAGVKVALKPFHMLTKAKNQEKVKGLAGKLAGDLKKIVGTFSDQSQVHLKYKTLEQVGLKEEQVFQVWVEETAIADMIVHRLLRNMYMIASHDVVQKFNEIFSKRVKTSTGTEGNSRHVEISKLQEKIKVMEDKLNGLTAAQEAISQVC